MFLGIDVTHLLATYGYWAVLLVVAAESMGLPLPGETMLVTAAVYAGLSGHLTIGLVIASAAAGAILGDTGGYFIGRTFGERALRRLAGSSGHSGRAFLVGRYLFQRRGGMAVFFGRFVAVLRIAAALLAGATCMPWPRFALYNATGSVLWATVMGLLGYGVGANATGTLGVVVCVSAIIVMLTVGLLLWRSGQRWEQEARQALVDEDAAQAA